MPKQARTWQPATDAELYSRYGYLPTMVVLHTRCGCTREIQVDVEGSNRDRDLPPLLGITLDPVSTFSPFWKPEESRMLEQETERIFFRVVNGKYGDGYHYEESGTEKPRPSSLTMRQRESGTRLITLEDER